MSKRKKHEPRVPLPVRGGIRAQGTRSSQSRSWWGRRWMLMLEGLRLGARLGRGRQYAVAGQIAALTLGEGAVSAVVQGGAPEPYRVTFTFRTLADGVRRDLTAVLGAHPAWLGRLLVNDLPVELEALFRDAGVPLFPERRGDWVCSCTCPDWAKPCKHAAAVLYLLGEAVEREPMLLLDLRGINRGDLIPAVGDRPGGGATPPSPPVRALAPPADAAAFWGDRWTPAETFGPPPGRTVAAPLLTRLGPLPFWRGQERFREMVEQVYGRATPVAMQIWGGERPDAVLRAKPAGPPDSFVLRKHRMQIDRTRL
jgi:uncharacterized Zn finger protein